MVIATSEMNRSRLSTTTRLSQSRRCLLKRNDSQSFDRKKTSESLQSPRRRDDPSVSVPSSCLGSTPASTKVSYFDCASSMGVCVLQAYHLRIHPFLARVTPKGKMTGNSVASVIELVKLAIQWRLARATSDKGSKHVLGPTGCSYFEGLLRCIRSRRIKRYSILMMRG